MVKGSIVGSCYKELQLVLLDCDVYQQGTSQVTIERVIKDRLFEQAPTFKLDKMLWAKF